MPLNLIAPQGRLYAEPRPSPDATTFRQNNTSEQYYNSPYYLAHKSQVQPIPPSRNSHPLDLSEFLPADVISTIQSAGNIRFHATGDTGAAKVNRSQTVATAIGHQAHVADAMAAEIQAQGDAGPAFFFNLGDVIYNFGEAQYYYDQFYEPYRAYDRPIFAIPGNHDGVVFGDSSSAPKVPSLTGFLENFCAPTPGPSPDAGSLVRSVMTQPGVYFTLDAPFVSIIGLYSNVLEGPGVISSQKGRFPLDDQQLDFLKSELSRLKPARQANQRAVVLAVHHPPLSADAIHGGSTGLQQDLDDCCQAAGLWPDIVLSGHAHLYQRFTRTTPTGQQTPYVVCGAGGYAVTAPESHVSSTGGPDDVDAKLEVGPILKFGYLTIETDAKTLSLKFIVAEGQATTAADTLTIDLTKNNTPAVAQGKQTSPTRKSRKTPAKAAKGRRPSRAPRAKPGSKKIRSKTRR